MYSLERCGEDDTSPVELYAFSGQLSSVNYPDYYDNNVDCYWRITIPSGIIELQFSMIYLDYYSDFLAVRNFYHESLNSNWLTYLALV